jgi:hypothetical protein
MRFPFPIKSSYYKGLVASLGILFLASSFFIRAGQTSAAEAQNIGTVSLEAAFAEPQQAITYRPSEVSADHWIQLSENSGIAIRDIRSKAIGPGKVFGTLWARIKGTWTVVDLGIEPTIMPVQK